jgi:hypothetical protein
MASVRPRASAPEPRCDSGPDSQCHRQHTNPTYVYRCSHPLGISDWRIPWGIFAKLIYWKGYL